MNYLSWQYRSAWSAFAVAVWTCLCVSPLASSQEETPTEPEISAQEIGARLNAIEEDSSIDDALRSQVLELYAQAEEQVRLSEEWRAKAVEFESARAGAPDLMEEIQAELLLPPPPISVEPPEDATVAELEQFLAESESLLTQLRAELTALEEEPARRAERRRQIPELRATARQRLDEAQSQLSTASPEGEPTVLTEAKHLVARARVQAIKQEQQAYTKELESYDARGRLLTARLDRATRRVSTADRVANAWRELVSNRRKTEAARAAAETREALLEASNAPAAIRELVRSLASENVRLAELRTGSDGILRRIEEVDVQLTRTQELLTNIESDFTSVRGRVGAAANSSAIGVLLRSHRAALPDVRDLRRNTRLRTAAISTIQLDQLESEESRRELADVEAIIADQLDELAPGATGNQRDRMAAMLRDAYQSQRTALDSLLGDIGAYFEKLVDLDGKEKQLIDTTLQFRDFIDEHILWTQSGSPFALKDFRNTGSALIWIALPRRALEVLDSLARDYVASPLVRTFTYVLPLGLLLSGRVVRRRVLDLGKEAAKRRCTRMSLTWRTVALVLLWSLGPTLVAGAIGWRLSASLYSNEFARALGQAVLASALAFWTLHLPRLAIRSGGLGEKHFGWPAEPMARLSRQLRRYAVPAVILVAFITFFESLGELDWQESIGRLSFSLLMLVSATMAYALFRPRGGALLDAFDLWRGKGRLGVRRFWFVLGTAVPVLLVVAAGSGYYYSALRLATRIYFTAFVAFVLLFAAAIVLRWSLMARRRLAIEQAKRRREALKAELKEGEKLPDEEELDLAKVDSQTGRLVRSALIVGLLVSSWFIWADFLPALSRLNEAEVWRTTVQTTTEIVLPSGDTQTQVVPTVVPITWRDIIVAILIGIATFIAVQNVPGLLEIAILQRLPLVAGERYAIKTIFGYGLILVGLVWMVNTVGIGWSQVQWLVAAVGLGLGFGLQEIFANFIAGLIILFEQPIRVGDTVTVGETSGRVSKIRIRATWITAFNRQELVVPNKEFVTGRLINWTLSDQVLRIEIPVGIAYGSNTKLAREILHDVAEKSEFVLKDPQPEVYFLGFGDSSLNFELRVYCPSIDVWLVIRDEMHQAIDDAFRAAGVEIAFPQRDVHIRSIRDTLPVSRDDESDSTSIHPE